MGGLIMEITETMWTEMTLKIQALEDELDKHIEDSNTSGVYTGSAPQIVKDYIADRKKAGEK